jgi:hypothetical protein
MVSQPARAERLPSAVASMKTGAETVEPSSRVREARRRPSRVTEATPALTRTVMLGSAARSRW